MGLFRLMSNRKKTNKEAKKYKHHRIKKAEIKKRKGTKVIELEHMELLSKEQLKNKTKNVHSNITVSGKRRRKMLKRLRHQERTRVSDAMEVEASKTNKSKKKGDKSAPAEDIEMSEDKETS